MMNFNSIYGAEALLEALLITPPYQTGRSDENYQEVQQALLLRTITTPKATLAVVRAGTIPYFADRYSIDELGKNDRYIAHEPMKRSSGLHRFIEFIPGHMKYDYGYSIAKQRPDVIVQLWEHDEHAEELRPYLQQYYGIRLLGNCLYLRKDSVNVLWDRFPIANVRSTSAGGSTLPTLDDGPNRCSL
jgi:hypothetical protein